MKNEDTTLHTEPVVRRFALAQIHPDKNAREEFDPDKLRELADSLKDTKGVLQPLLGVLREDGGVDLIAGERRLRASALAGLPDVEVKLVERPSRKDHLKWNLVENLQRENLKPLEKAKRIQEMLELVDETSGLPIYNRASLAVELGISDSSIGRHEALLKASAKVQKAVNDDGLDIEIGALIGSLPPALRDRAEKEMVFRNWGGPMKREEAVRHAATYRRDLRKAQFDKKDAELVPDAGPCEACPYFGLNRDDVEGKSRGYTCLNPECFEQKQQAHVTRVAAAAENEGTRVLGQTSTDRVFQSWNNQVNPSSGFVDLKDEPDAYLLKDTKSKAPKWDKILEGSGVPVVIAFDHEGRVRRLVEAKLAVEAAKRGEHAEKFKPKAGDDLETSDDKKHAAQISRAKNKAASASLLEGCCAMLEAFSGQRWTREVRLTFLDEICNSGGHTRDDLELLCRILQPDLKSVPNPHEKLAELVELRLPTDTGLDAFILIARNIRSIRYNGFHHIVNSTGMKVYCEWAGFDAVNWKATCAQRERDAEREAKAAIRAKEKPVKKAKGKERKLEDGSEEPESSRQEAAEIAKATRCFSGKDAVGMVKAMLEAQVEPQKPNAHGVIENPLRFKMSVMPGVSFTLMLAAVRQEEGSDFEIGYTASMDYECKDRSGGGLPPDGHVSATVSSRLLDVAKDGLRDFAAKSDKAHAEGWKALNEVVKLLKKQSEKDTAAWHEENNPQPPSLEAGDGPIMTAAKRGIVFVSKPGTRGKSANAKDYQAAAAKKDANTKAGRKAAVEELKAALEKAPGIPVGKVGKPEGWNADDVEAGAKLLKAKTHQMADLIGTKPNRKDAIKLKNWNAVRLRLLRKAEKAK